MEPRKSPASRILKRKTHLCKALFWGVWHCIVFHSIGRIQVFLTVWSGDVQPETGDARCTFTERPNQRWQHIYIMYIDEVATCQWLFLVSLIGGRWHIIPQLAVYTTYQGEPETTIEHVLVMCLIIVNGSQRYRGATEVGQADRFMLMEPETTAVYKHARMQFYMRTPKTWRLKENSILRDYCRLYIWNLLGQAVETWTWKNGHPWRLFNQLSS